MLAIDESVLRPKGEPSVAWPNDHSAMLLAVTGMLGGVYWRCWAGLILFSCLYAPTLKQASSPIPYQTSTIRTATKLVEIVFCATGPHGSPISGLTESDVKLYRDGQHQSIAILENSNNEKLKRNTHPHLGQYSNDVSAHDRNIVVLLLDGIDTAPTVWARSWGQVVHFLKGLHSSDHLAIYVLTPTQGLQVLQNYDEGSNRLIDRLRTSKNPTLANLVQGPFDSEEPRFSSRQLSTDSPQLFSMGRVFGLTNAIETIAEHLTAVPGGKSLLWLSGHFPNAFVPEKVQGLEFARVKLLKAINGLISANVAIYPVDANGLVPDHAFDAQNEDLPAPLMDGPSEPYLFVQSDFAVLGELANRSGGRAYANTNGLAAVMANIFRDRTAPYLVGFYDTAQPDNKFHRVRIRIDRHGTHLRYRPGYWSLKDNTQFDAGERDRELKLALESPFLVAEVPMQANADVTRDNRTVLTIYIDNDGLASPDLQQQTSAVEIVLAEKDAYGRVFAKPPYRVLVKTNNPDQHLWLTTQTDINVRPRIRSIRIVVRDERSGHLGSLDVPILHDRKP